MNSEQKTQYGSECHQLRSDCRIAENELMAFHGWKPDQVKAIRLTTVGTEDAEMERVSKVRLEHYKRILEDTKKREQAKGIERG